MKCEKCGDEMILVYEENKEFCIEKIYKCTNIRCGYMSRELIYTNK